MSLVARYLEAAGLPTVVLGSALDIVTHCGVPRFVFSDFPLGNPCGRPDDPDMQREIVGAAVSFLQEASAPRSVLRAPHQWGEDSWRARYMEIRPEDAELLARKGAENRARRQQLKSAGRTRQDG